MKLHSPLADPADDDCRLYAIARLVEDWANSWTAQTVPKESRLTVSSVMQLTKKKQLTILLPNTTGRGKCAAPVNSTLNIAKNHCPATRMDIASQSMYFMFNCVVLSLV